MHIASDKPNAAVEWIEKIEAKCLLIASNPGIGEAAPHLGQSVQVSFVGRYVIYYRVAHKQTEILRIISADRNTKSL